MTEPMFRECQDQQRRAIRRPSLLVFALLLGVGACSARTSDTIPENVSQPDRYLLDRGTEELQQRHWLDAREYFRRVVDNYPNSPLRPDAKLGVGDTYLGEDSTESLILAANEYREFLAFYPTNARADYAQYKLAMTHFEQMRAPERDQTETREALKEFNVFFERYPTSPLASEVKQKWREARDRLSEASYRVGLHYYRQNWNPGAIDRFREVLRDDPGYTGRDHVYFYLAEALARSDNPKDKAEAITYYERLLEEFDTSDHLEDATKRLQEVKAQLGSGENS